MTVDLIKGIDVSQYQGKNLPWQAIKDSGVEFVIARAGHGVTVDPTFMDNINGASWVGLATGAYWYFEADHDPEHQADLFLDATEFVDMVPFIDFESLEGRTPAQALVACEEVGRELEMAGDVPILYTCFDFWHAKLGNPVDSWLTTLDLWVANYGVKTPLVPDPWKKRGWRMWQYDGDGGERLPDGRDSDFVWSVGPVQSFFQQRPGVDRPDIVRCTLEGPENDRRKLVGWLNESTQSMLAEGEADRDARIRARED